jgi:hypothetical protein
VARQRDDEAICNDFEQRITYQASVDAMQGLDWSPPPYESEGDLPQADHVRISDIGAIVRAEAFSEALELSAVQWRELHDFARE